MYDSVVNHACIKCTTARNLPPKRLSSGLSAAVTPTRATQLPARRFDLLDHPNNLGYPWIRGHSDPSPPPPPGAREEGRGRGESRRESETTSGPGYFNIRRGVRTLPAAGTLPFDLASR